MKLVMLAAVALLVLPILSAAQGIDYVSVCVRSDPEPTGAILTICDHGSGMTAIPQPRLYLRIFGDGRAEYESNRPYREDGIGDLTLVKKTFRVSQSHIEEIRALGRESDLQAAKDVYPRYRMWDDSSLETTVLFTADGRTKKIVINNFGAWNKDNKKYYPLSLIHLMRLSSTLWKGANGIVDRVDSINFSDVVKDPEQFLDRPIKIYASVELRDGSVYLSDGEGPSASQYSGAIKIGFTSDQSFAPVIRKQVAIIQSDKFGGRARVLVSAILRDSLHPTKETKYDLLIDGFENIEPIVLPYEGRLEPGWVYSDAFDAVKGRELTLSSPLKLLPHHAGRIEWTNAADFPKLLSGGRIYITFRVTSSSISRQGTGRWNDVYLCEILNVTPGR